jgi:hypothetical protein
MAGVDKVAQVLRCVKVYFVVISDHSASHTTEKTRKAR